METQQEKRPYKKGSSTVSPVKKKANTKEQLDALEASILKPTEQEPASSSKDQPAPKTKAVPVKQVGIQLIEGQPKSWWKGQNIATIKAQAELRGHRFEDTETKGKGFVKKNELFVKAKKYKKADYLEVLLGLLKL